MTDEAEATTPVAPDEVDAAETPEIEEPTHEVDEPARMVIGDE